VAAPSLVLGTAGHIDHGKTSLIKALTGTDTDRLSEEKERGITIELGFARLDLPSGRSMGVVDVPGHERFVRQMVAGATGVDVVLLVVAADDGVMPQTREHISIIDLLGVRQGVVAVTKADLVDPDWLDLVAEEVGVLLEGTSMEGAPVVSVSSKTGEGVEDLRTALDEVANVAQSRQLGLPLRLPVDRVFTIAGAGTVVTGTMWSGSAHRDDQAELMPSGAKCRIRGVQVHSESVDEAVAGQRVALNLVGIEKDEVSRGDIVAAPGTLTVTGRFDGRLTYLASEEKSLETGTRVHVHHGTREVIGRVLLMDDAAALLPGESALVQVRLEEPLSPRYDDHFIIRSYSPMWTIGGGVILDVLPPRRTHLSAAERALLGSLLDHDVAAAAVGLLTSRGVPMTSVRVAAQLGVARGDVADSLNRADLARLKVGGEAYFVASDALERLITVTETSLLEFHDEQPKATGVSRKALKDRVDPHLEAKVFDAILDMAQERGVATMAGGEVRHPKAAVSALAAEEEAVSSLLPLLHEQALAPSTVKELAASAGVDPGVARKALGRLVSEGRVVRLGPDLHFATEVVEAANSALVTYLTEHQTATAGEARDVIGTSRKYVVPLLEYFDAQGITKRDGDVRTLRKG